MFFVRLGRIIGLWTVHPSFPITTLRIFTLACVLAGSRAMAIPVEFSWMMELYSGDYVHTYDPNWFDADRPWVSGRFIIDDQLTDSNPDPQVAEYVSPALLTVSGAAGSLSTTATFRAHLAPINSGISISGLSAGIYFDLYDSHIALANISEIFTRSMINIEGTFGSIWGGAASDDSASFRYLGPYDPASLPVSTAVPESLGLAPFVTALGLFALVRSKKTQKVGLRG
jgi:hypothetical protein